MSEAPTRTQRTLARKKTLVFSLVPVVVLFAFLEATARVVEIWRPPRPVDLGQGFSPESRVFVPSKSDPGVMVTNPDKAVSFVEHSFAKRKPRRTMRIFALGGSSVNYLAYEFSQLEKRLQKALASRYDQVEIINCGGLSYGSHRLVLVTAEVLAYEPDLLLLYSGHNEFEELEQMDLANLGMLPLQRAFSKSALYRFIRDRIASYQIGRLEAAHDERLMATAIPDTSKTWNHKFTDEEVAARMDAFRANLSSIMQMCTDRDVPIIVGTVPSNLIKPNLPGAEGIQYHEVLDLFAENEYEQGLRLARQILRQATRHQASDAENDTIRALTAQHGIPLADVETAIIAAEPNHVPGETLFSDHCHLNPEGNRILARTYEQQILRLFHAAGAQ